MLSFPLAGGIGAGIGVAVPTLLQVRGVAALGSAVAAGAIAAYTLFRATSSVTD